MSRRATSSCSVATIFFGARAPQASSTRIGDATEYGRLATSFQSLQSALLAFQKFQRIGVQ